MKKNGFAWSLAAAGLLSAAASVLFRERLGSLAGLTALPFAPLAAGLRALSLSGGAGNIAAWALYLILCLSPLLVFALKKRPAARRDLLAPVTSLLLFGGMYLLINPGKAASLPGAAALLTQGGGALIGGILWSVLSAWAVLELLARSKAAGASALPRLLEALLMALCLFTVVSVCLLQPAGAAQAVEALRAANTGAASGLLLTEWMLVLGSLTEALPALLTVPVALGCIRLLQALTGGFDDRAVAAADRLAWTASGCLTASVTAGLVFNLLQLALCGLLRSASWQLELPLTELAFALGALLLARYVRESKRLQEESDLFI